MKYFISAGEASGDLHGAPLISSIRNLDPQAEFTFLGGDLMAAAARRSPLIHFRDMAFMAFSEVLRNLRKIFYNLNVAKQAITNERPDAVVLIDYPSFNLKLAKHAASLGIPVYYYISPKVWAWKEWRVKSIRKYCRRVLSILPFETDFFRRHNMEVEYVGNPSKAEIEERASKLPPRQEFLKQWNLPDSKPILALLAGSRRGEIRNNLPIMDQVATMNPGYTAVIAGAPSIETEFYRNYSSLPIVSNATFELLANADSALVTSGTATLEAAILSTPQVVCYRANGSRLSYNIMKRLIKAPFVSLPNLIAGRAVLAEMLLHECTPLKVNEQLRLIAPGSPQRKQMLDAYADIRARLGNLDAPSNAARSIINDINSLKNNR